MRYLAFALNLSGVAQAAYLLHCPDDDNAKVRAQRFLQGHPVVEVWNGPVRVARLLRPENEAGEPKDQRAVRSPAQNSPSNQPHESNQRPERSGLARPGQV